MKGKQGPPLLGLKTKKTADCIRRPTNHGRNVFYQGGDKRRQRGGKKSGN